MDYSVTRKMPKLMDHAVKIVKKNYADVKDIHFGLTSATYVFTTENINGYYDRLDFNGKDVLTVVGSGDHILNAVLRGATNIDSFDISGFAILFYYLKEAALKALSYEEFVMFFLSKNNSFNDKLYLKIRLFLEDSVLLFWDKIYSSCKSNEIIGSGMFRVVEPRFINDCNQKVKILSSASSYLEEEKYYILKEKIKNANVQCYLKDFYNLEPKGTYNYIFLSNIMQFNENKELFERTLGRYISKLKVGGEIKFHYIYQANLKYIFNNSFDLCYSIEQVPAIYDMLMTPDCIKNKDSILTYKKK